MNAKIIPFSEITVEKGFWSSKQKMIAEVSLPHIFSRFDETNRFSTIAPWWKNPTKRAHIYFDSDTAKWIEAAAYVLKKSRDAYPELEKLCDMLISRFVSLQRRNGYLNSFFQRTHLPVFSCRTDHELYCAGHLAEAALAYFNATGKRNFLDAVDKYLDYIRLRFVVKQNASFVTPGHEEIELALYRLYEATGEKKYKELADFFINKRGTVKEKTYREYVNGYDQSDAPVRELSSAEGHCVRAMYLYCAMADMARLDGDEQLAAACRRLYADTLTKMYVTGGIGSSYIGEVFTIPYDLPNLTAYSESCAAIGLLLFSGRMSLLENKATYAETVERVMYNNLLSGISLDGKSFFYENPLEINLSEFTKSRTVKAKPRLPITQRKEVFETSCCPANIARIIATVADNIFLVAGDTLYVQQYVPCTARSDVGKIKIVTDFPASGKIKITGEGMKVGKIALRLPPYVDNYTVSVNGSMVSPTSDNGYLIIDISNEFCIEAELLFMPKYVRANPLADMDRGRVALTYGPVVYCIEGVDNGDLRGLAVNPSKTPVPVNDSFVPFPCLEAEGYRLSMDGTYSYDEPKAEKTTIKFIPYFAFANRGESDMKVWIPIK